MTVVFSRIPPVIFNGDDFEAVGDDDGDGGTVAATFNAAEVAAWNLANAAPTSADSTGELGYLQACMAAAKTALYTLGTQVGGAGQFNSLAFGVGNTLRTRLRALGVIDNG
jgi:hypothetical protein